MPHADEEEEASSTLPVGEGREGARARREARGAEARGAERQDAEARGAERQGAERQDAEPRGAERRGDLLARPVMLIIIIGTPPDMTLGATIADSGRSQARSGSVRIIRRDRAIRRPSS